MTLMGISQPGNHILSSIYPAYISWVYVARNVIRPRPSESNLGKNITKYNTFVVSIGSDAITCNSALFFVFSAKCSQDFDLTSGIPKEFL